MSMRPVVQELIVVEGKCDISAVKAAVDCDVIETRGFGIFHSPGIGERIRRLAGERGVILLTDSDRSGFRIRQKLRSILHDIQVKNAYIPQIVGVEKRKTQPSRDGFLGVEAMRQEIILEALRKAGATFGEERLNPKGDLSKADLYALGLSGGKGSAEKRNKLLEAIGLPRGITANALLELINISFTREEFTAFLSSLT